MEWRVRGSPDGGPALDLDHGRFSYAGKFRMTGTGKAVAEDDGAILAAAAFDRDRTDADTAVIRYVTVRADRRGEGVGARLLAFAVDELLDRVSRVRIAVNNPFAFEAAYKAGFAFTGDRTGLAELVLATDADRSPAGYRDGLAAFRDRSDLAEDERAFLAARDPDTAIPPNTIEPPA